MSAAAGSRPALAAERGAALLAERHGTRGEKPALKKNLIARPQVQMGETRIMVKDPDRTKYYVFADYEWRLIELYDGTRTRSGIGASRTPPSDAENRAGEPSARYRAARTPRGSGTQSASLAGQSSTCTYTVSPRCVVAPHGRGDTGPPRVP